MHAQSSPFLKNLDTFRYCFSVQALFFCIVFLDHVKYLQIHATGATSTSANCWHKKSLHALGLFDRNYHQAGGISALRRRCQASRAISGLGSTFPSHKPRSARMTTCELSSSCRTILPGQLPAGGWPGARAGWLAARVHPVSLRFMHDACMI